MKPFEQWTPEELLVNLEAAMNEASVHDLIDALAAVQGCESLMEDASRRQLIRLLAAKLVLRTMRPDYIEGVADAGKG